MLVTIRLFTSNLSTGSDIINGDDGPHSGQEVGALPQLRKPRFTAADRDTSKVQLYVCTIRRDDGTGVATPRVILDISRDTGPVTDLPQRQVALLRATAQWIVDSERGLEKLQCLLPR